MTIEAIYQFVSSYKVQAIDITSLNDFSHFALNNFIAELVAFMDGKLASGLFRNYQLTLYLKCDTKIT